MLAVDYTGSAATGKVEADYGDWRSMDYVQLLKVEGRWQIVSKVNERVVVVDHVRQ
jgi:hypothetical protein